MRGAELESTKSKLKQQSARADELAQRMRAAIGQGFIVKDTEICTRYQIGRAHV